MQHDSLLACDCSLCTHIRRLPFVILIGIVLGAWFTIFTAVYFLLP